MMYFPGSATGPARDAKQGVRGECWVQGNPPSMGFQMEETQCGPFHRLGRRHGPASTIILGPPTPHVFQSCTQARETAAHIITRTFFVDRYPLEPPPPPPYATMLVPGTPEGLRSGVEPEADRHVFVLEIAVDGLGAAVHLLRERKRGTRSRGLEATSLRGEQSDFQLAKQRQEQRTIVATAYRQITLPRPGLPI